MGRKGKFKPLLVSREERTQFVDEFFLRLDPSIVSWREGCLPAHELVGIYWREFMQLWRPRDWKSGRYYRSCPERAHRGYELWCEQPDLIRLTEKLPLAHDLLLWQCEGRRVLTLVTNRAEFLEEVHGRDPLSFLLHDLIHAYEFFSDREQMQAQIVFYRQLQKDLQNREELRQRLNSDKIFTEKFEYLIADMNSHPAHLEAYYQHILRASN